jgi:hypothetical protein
MYLPEYSLIVWLDIILSCATTIMCTIYVVIWLLLPKYIKELRGSVGHQLTWLMVLIGQGFVAAASAHFSFTLIDPGRSFPLHYWLLLRTGALFSMLSTTMLMLSVVVKDSRDAMRALMYLNSIDSKILSDRARLEREE